MSPSKQPVIEMRNIKVKLNSKGYEKTSLKNINFDILDGEFLAIIGKSTSGKTLLTNVLTNDFKFNSYISNGSAMYYPNTSFEDDAKNKLDYPTDLVNYHKSLTKKITEKMFKNAKNEIIRVASIKLSYFRTAVAEMQYNEAKKQQARLFAIYKKSLSMKIYDSFFYVTDEFAKNKSDSINNHTSPSVPVVLELLDKMRHEEKNISQEYLNLSSSSLSNEKKHWSSIQKSKSKIAKCKRIISHIQVYIAQKNLQFMKALKNDIKFLTNNQFKTGADISQKSIMKMHEFNTILKIDKDPKMLSLINKITEQQKIIDDANFELDNFNSLDANTTRQLKNLVSSLEKNQTDLSLVDTASIDKALVFLNSLRTLNELELRLKLILEKLIHNKKVSANDMQTFLEIWKYKTEHPFKKRKVTKNKTKLIENTIVKVDYDPMLNLKANITIGKQLSDVFSLNINVMNQSLKEQVLEWMDKFSIPEAKDVYYQTPVECSDDVRKLVSIAVALARRPKILILDEATNDLGSALQNQILETILLLKEASNFTVIMVSNDLGIVNKYADRIAIMHKGKIVEYGEKNEIISSPVREESKLLVKSLSEIMDGFQAQVIKNNNLFSILNSNTQMQEKQKSLCNKNNYECCQKFMELSNNHFVMDSKNCFTIDKVGE